VHRTLLTAIALPPITLLALGLLAPVASAADDCQALSTDDRIAAIEKAPTCRQSMAQFMACAYGASGDVALGVVVVKKCEADFLSRLNGSRRRAYEKAQTRCVEKYARQAGTMYRSLTAFCQAMLASSYADRFAAH
jgi:hypothetical protein